jgi:hypothetical protein
LNTWPEYANFFNKKIFKEAFQNFENKGKNMIWIKRVFTCRTMLFGRPSQIYLMERSVRNGLVAIPMHLVYQENKQRKINLRNNI